ncbi:MAG: 16S rRNA (cytosine(967)-C(5))-methyltransferase RsmB [Gammaproteobacteria bacterium]|nr:16S rRNA (cytosine(967)-C(5))-methyltransferase RsmB [Gammaproteobacteria bacterium]
MGWCLTEKKRGHTTPDPRNPRAAAARLLHQLIGGKSLSGLFETGIEGVSQRDIGLVKELCFGVARWYPQLEAISSLLINKPMKARDRDILALILLGLYQLQHMRVATHAALSETVDATRVLGKPWAAGLVNALLRRYLREGKQLLKRVDQSPPARFAHPDWLLQALQKAWPDHWDAIVDANNQRPPMSLRVNLAKTTRAAYFKQLREAAIPASPISLISSGMCLDRPVDITMLPGFNEGLVSIQDGGAQLAATLLDSQPGQRILDACAAPGGKTGHILEIQPGQLQMTALDIDDHRLAKVQDNLDRLGLSARLSRGDAARPGGEWAKTRYDRILLDVPCSATGVIRRHPDIKLLRNATDIPALALLQSEILDAIWPLLAVGGRLVYATCSLLPEENQLQIARFLKHTPNAQEIPIEAPWGHAMNPGRQILPGESTMDGFYYACLVKT